jgi:hypothetical protein
VKPVSWEALFSTVPKLYVIHAVLAVQSYILPVAVAYAAEPPGATALAGPVTPYAVVRVIEAKAVVPTNKTAIAIHFM